jgi:hypothetical protein
MDDHFEQQAGGIDQQMPFPAAELLGSIVAVGTAPLGRFHRLAVDDGSTGRCPPAAR